MSDINDFEEFDEESDLEDEGDYPEMWMDGYEEELDWDDEISDQDSDQVFANCTLYKQQVKFQMQDEGLISFRVPLEYRDKLREVDLDDNQIDLLASDFYQCPNLELISLRGNQISDINPLLQPKSLKSLILSRNLIHDDAIFATSGLNNLEQLHLAYNHIDKSIFHLLDIGKNLKKLSLMQNPFIATSLQPFMKALLKLRNLENLIIGHHTIIPEWEHLVAEYIASNPTVVELVVYGVKDCTQILLALKQNTILKKLYLLGPHELFNIAVVYDSKKVTATNLYLDILKLDNQDTDLIAESSVKCQNSLFDSQVRNTIKIFRYLKLLPMLEPVKDIIIKESLNAFPYSDAEAMCKYFMRNPKFDTSLPFDHHLFKRRCIIECGPQPSMD